MEERERERSGSRFTTIPPSSPPSDLVHYTLDEMKQWRNEREMEETNGWTDSISQGPFCTTFSCFFFGYTSDELVRGRAPEGEDEGGDRERVRARYIDWSTVKRTDGGHVRLRGREEYFSLFIHLSIYLSSTSSSSLRVRPRVVPHYRGKIKTGQWNLLSMMHAPRAPPSPSLIHWRPVNNNSWYDRRLIGRLFVPGKPTLPMIDVRALSNANGLEGAVIICVHTGRMGATRLFYRSFYPPDCLSILRDEIFKTQVSIYDFTRVC